MNGVDIESALCPLSAPHKAVYNALMAAWKWKRHVWFDVLNSNSLWKENLTHYAFVEKIRLSEDSKTYFIDMITDADGVPAQRFTADIREIDASSLVVTR